MSENRSNGYNWLRRNLTRASAALGLPMIGKPPTQRQMLAKVHHNRDARTSIQHRRNATLKMRRAQVKSRKLMRPTSQVTARKLHQFQHRMGMGRMGMGSYPDVNMAMMHPPVRRSRRTRKAS